MNKILVTVESLEEANLHTGIVNGCQDVGLETSVMVVPRNTAIPDEIYNSRIMREFERFKPDYFLSIKGTCLNPETVKAIGQHCRTINWQLDDPYEFNSGEAINLAKPYQYVFTTDRSTFPRYDKPGGVLPFAFDPQNHKRLGCEKDIDVSFVGIFSRSRSIFLGSAPYVRCFGAEHPRYEQGRIPHVEMVKIVNRSKININYADQHDGFLGLKNRVFEILGCGGFLLTQNFYNLTDYFKPGIHLEVFKTEYELKRKTAIYLSNPQLREQIAALGYREVLSHHKYSDRIKEMLEAVNAQTL
jgi:spore maturation protein CgeB